MSQSQLRLGPFQIDLDRRELTRDGALIRLGGRAFDILCVLASARGDVVSKDELMARVWPGVIVEENNIQVHVSALRKALDEGQEKQNLLQTVPNRGYRLVGFQPVSAGTPAAPDKGVGPAVLKKSAIAVLPFQNMSGDPEQEYFADGMVDEIITGLSRIKWLSVISRNSSFNYKNKPVVIKEIAERFGVRYVLEGGVRKSGSRIRITVQLIDTANDAHLWAEQYDRVQEDVFALQDEITMHVIGAIEPSLRKAELERVKRQRPNNLNAYDLVLRSLPFALSHVPQESEMAIPLLQDALALQPDYAAAHAFLGRCLHHRYARGGLREEDRLAAIHHAQAAIAYGSDDATALAAAAHVIALDEHDTTVALKLFERALELSNSNVFALSFSAVILAWMGRTDLATSRAELALRLSPFDLYNFRAHHALAIVHFCSRRYLEAANAARNAIHANSSFSMAHAVLAAALMRSGRPAEAGAAATRVLQHEPTFTIHGVWLVAGQLDSGVFGALADTWREVGLPE